jgi:hypothetical protein
VRGLSFPNASIEARRMILLSHRERLRVFAMVFLPGYVST